MNQDSGNAAAGLLAGGIFLVVYFVIIIAVVAFMIWLFWRIFTKAGMSGALSFLFLIPFFGPLIAVCILAFGTWKVVPAPQQAYGSLPPSYPPQNLPPGNYPPRY